MEKQEKKTKVSGVYLVLAALTVLFAVSLVFLHKTAYEGPSLAQAIIDYRAEHGDFTAAEDLLNVKGIGEAKLEGFRAEITFTEEDGNENSGG